MYSYFSSFLGEEDDCFWLCDLESALPMLARSIIFTEMCEEFGSFSLVNSAVIFGNLVPALD